MNGLSKTGRYVRKLVRGATLAIGGVLALLLLYLVAAVAGTVWTAAPDSRQTDDDTTTIYVLSNGFHSDIVLPVDAAAELPIAATDLPGRLAGTRYLILGWGSQTAYTSLLALTDMTIEIAAKALLFDRSVMHLLPYGGEMQGPGVYRLELGPDQLHKLVEFIDATFSVDADGRGELLPGITQGYGDVFYRARPRFSLFYGCNAWTGEALRHAGVPVGVWTPFAQSIEWNMERLSVR